MGPQVAAGSLVGRAAELALLEAAMAAATAGDGSAVLVAGEAGIGKSRLVREFAERLGRDGWVVQRGTCFERDRLLPYAPLLDVLRALLASLPRRPVIPSRKSTASSLRWPPSSRAWPPASRCSWWSRTSTGPTIRALSYWPCSPVASRGSRSCCSAPTATTR